MSRVPGANSSAPRTAHNKVIEQAGFYRLKNERPRRAQPRYPTPPAVPDRAHRYPSPPTPLHASYSNQKQRDMEHPSSANSHSKKGFASSTWAFGEAPPPNSPHKDRPQAPPSMPPVPAFGMQNPFPFPFPNGMPILPPGFSFPGQTAAQSAQQVPFPTAQVGSPGGQHQAARAGRSRGSMLKERTNKICVSYTISEDMSGNRRNRILSRISEKKRDSGEASLRKRSSYTDRLSLRDRRSVSTRDSEEHVEKSDSEAELIVLPGKNGNFPSKTRISIRYEDIESRSLSPTPTPMTPITSVHPVRFNNQMTPQPMAMPRQQPQTVPDTPTMCADVDIFDGFGSGGIGVPSNFPGYNGNGTSGGDFKIEPDNDFNHNTVPRMPAFDKRIEELGSPSTGEETVNSPFTSPQIIGSPTGGVQDWQIGPNGRVKLQQGVQGAPQQNIGTLQQRAMPPPSAPATGAATNGRIQPSSPQQNAAPPTPSQTNKANPKKKPNRQIYEEFAPKSQQEGIYMEERTSSTTQRSSVPGPLVATTRSSLSKPPASDSDSDRSSPPINPEIEIEANRERQKKKSERDRQRILKDSAWNAGLKGTGASRKRRREEDGELGGGKAKRPPGLPPTRLMAATDLSRLKGHPSATVPAIHPDRLRAFSSASGIHPDPGQYASAGAQPPSANRGAGRGTRMLNPVRVGFGKGNVQDLAQGLGGPQPVRPQMAFSLLPGLRSDQRPSEPVITTPASFTTTTQKLRVR